MDEKTRECIRNRIGLFRDKRILVVGDSILDAYEHVKQIGYSLENPTAPKFEHERTEFFYGGAANVVRNILELGGRVSFVTLLGDDENAMHYRDFKHENLKLIPVVEEGRKTTVKRRTLVDDEEIFRVNRQEHRELSAYPGSVNLYNAVSKEINSSDVVLFVDYRHGMLNGNLIHYLKDLAKEHGKRAIASSQVSQRESNHQDYAGVYMICMNMKEAVSVYPDFSASKLDALASRLESNVCVTLGKDGSIIRINGLDYRANGINVKEKDTTGAGDCFLAALALADFEQNPEAALYLGNIWAGLSVANVGTQTPKLEDLIRFVEK